MTPARFSALFLSLLLSCAMPVKRTTAAPPHAEAQAPTADTLLASDSVRTKSFLDSFPDAVSYPGTTLEPKAEGPDAESLGKAIGSAYGPMVRTAVYFSGRHSLLDSMLPGVDFVRAHVENDFDLEGWARHAVKGGKLQRLDALNRLLLDAGFTFDSTEMPTIAKIVVLFATFGRGPTPSDTAPGAGFPAITFLSVKKGEWQHPRHAGISNLRRGMYVDCIVDGLRMPLFVRFTNRQPEEVFVVDGTFLGEFSVVLGRNR